MPGKPAFLRLPTLQIGRLRKPQCDKLHVLRRRTNRRCSRFRDRIRPCINTVCRSRAYSARSTGAGLRPSAETCRRGRHHRHRERAKCRSRAPARPPDEAQIHDIGDDPRPRPIRLRRRTARLPAEQQVFQDVGERSAAPRGAQHLENDRVVDPRGGGRPRVRRRAPARRSASRTRAAHAENELGDEAADGVERILAPAPSSPTGKRRPPP